MFSLPKVPPKKGLIDFPDPRKSRQPDGILVIGGEVSPQNLLAAYSKGIFPWPMQVGEVAPGEKDRTTTVLCWFSPPQRAILNFRDLHIPDSLKRAKSRAVKQGWQYTFDRAFDQVIAECAASPRPGQDGTWITSEILKSYSEFHKLGHAHSCEVWDSTNRLIGGIYGVATGNAFAGESMFFKEPNASKIALLHLIERLEQNGLDWLDIQVLTPHLQALGAKLIPRNEFLDRLERELPRSGSRSWAR